jgi:putative transposase
MNRPGRYPQELRERAVRMVFEPQDEHPSQWAAIRSIAAKFGIPHETLRHWVRRAATDEGSRPGLTSDERERLMALERESGSCGGPMRSSSPRRFSSGRSSTADRRDDRLHRRQPGPVRVEPICRVLPIARPPITRRAGGRPRPAGAATRSSQYLAIRYTERLAEAGAVTSVGSRGDSYDNALAETIIGLYKAELIRRRGPWRGLDEVEYATLEWVDWFNHRRLLEPIGHVPPAEFEAAYHQREDPSRTAGRKQPKPPVNPGRFTEGLGLVEALLSFGLSGLAG